MNMDIFYTVFPSPLGLIGVAATKKGLCRVKIDLANERDFKISLEADYGRDPQKYPKALENVRNQMEMYFAGKCKKFTFPLDLSYGTDFQRQVWKKLMAIPYGKTWSYKCLAGAVKRPNASRAVGNANGRNRIPIIVPCHRVTLKNGGLGGYTGGTHIKQFLLGLENQIHAAL